MTYDAEVLIVGCGNVLFKDDGFGPAVIKEIEEHISERPLPDNVMTIDAGTSAPHYLFSLPNSMWRKIIILDIADFNGNIGELRLLNHEDMPTGKYQDPHSLSVNDPLEDLEACEIVIIGCKPEHVSSPYVEYGLTKPVQEAVPKAIDMAYTEVEKYMDTK